MFLWCGYQLFQVAWLCFEVAVQYFEEIPLDLQENNKKMERVEKAYWM